MTELFRGESHIYVEFNTTSGQATVNVPFSKLNRGDTISVYVMNYFVKGAAVTSSIPNEPMFYIKTNATTTASWTKNAGPGDYVPAFLISGSYTANYLARPEHIGDIIWNGSLTFSIVDSTSSVPTFTKLGAVFVLAKK